MIFFHSFLSDYTISSAEYLEFIHLNIEWGNSTAIAL